MEDVKRAAEQAVKEIAGDIASQLNTIEQQAMERVAMLTLANHAGGGESEINAMDMQEALPVDFKELMEDLDKVRKRLEELC
jgi:hypothetical protein